MEHVAALENGVGRRDFTVGLHLDLDLLLQGVWLFVAGESDLAVLEQLMSEHVAQRVVLALDQGSTGEALLLVILVDDADRLSEYAWYLLSDERCLLGKASWLRLFVRIHY